MNKYRVVLSDGLSDVFLANSAKEAQAQAQASIDAVALTTDQEPPIITAIEET